MFFKNIYNDIRSRYNIVWSFKGIYLALTSFFRKKPTDVDILFVSHDVHRNAKKKDKLYSPLIDPIIESVNEDNKYNILSLATPFSQHFGAECFGNVRIHSYDILVSFLKRMILRGSFSLKYVKNDPLIKAYEKLLVKINPKIIIGTQPSVELCIAANRLNIKTYDVQHGLISDVNYYAIAKRKLINQEGWPDNVLCWDKESAVRLERITNGFGDPLIIGHPSYHSKYGKELHTDQIVKQKKDFEYKNTFLVTLTYHNYGATFEDYYYRDLGIPKELITLMLTLPNTFWRIRLHPVQHKFHFKSVDSLLSKIFKNKNNVNWELYSDISFGAAISGCTGHITVSSASALDAAQNSVPTLFVGCPGVVDYKIIKSYFDEYLSSGIMTYVNSIDLNNSSFNFFKTSEISLNSQNKKNNDSERNFLNFIEKIQIDINK